MSSSPTPSRTKESTQRNLDRAKRPQNPSNAQKQKKKQSDQFRTATGSNSSTSPPGLTLAEEADAKQAQKRQKRLLDIKHGRGRQKRSEYIDKEIAKYKEIGELPKDKFLYLDALAVEEPVHPEELEARYLFYGGASIFRKAVRRLKAKNKPRIITNIDEEIRWVSNRQYIDQIDIAKERAVDVLEQQFFDEEVKKLQSIGKLPDDEDQLKYIKDQTYYRLKEAMTDFRQDPDLGADHGVLDLDTTEAQIDHFLGHGLTYSPPDSLLQKMGLEDPREEFLRNAEFGNESIDDFLFHKVETEGIQSLSPVNIEMLYNHHTLGENSSLQERDNFLTDDGEIDVERLKADYLSKLPVLSDARSLTHLRSMLSGDLMGDANVTDVTMAGQMARAGTSAGGPDGFNYSSQSSSQPKNKEMNLLQRLKQQQSQQDRFKQLKKASLQNNNQQEISQNNNEQDAEPEYPPTSRRDMRNAIHFDKMLDKERENLYFDMEWTQPVENMHDVKRYNVPPIFSDEFKGSVMIKRKPDWHPDELVNQTEIMMDNINDRLKQQREDNKRPENWEFVQAWQNSEKYDWPKAKDLDFKDPRWFEKFYHKPHMEGDFEVYGEYESYIYPTYVGQREWNAMHSHLPSEARYMERFNQTFQDKDSFLDRMIASEAVTDDHFRAHESMQYLDDIFGNFDDERETNKKIEIARQINKAINPEMKFHHRPQAIQKYLQQELRQDSTLVDHRYMNMIKEVIPNLATDEMSDEEKDGVHSDMLGYIFNQSLSPKTLSNLNKAQKDMTNQANNLVDKFQSQVDTLQQIYHAKTDEEHHNIQEMKRLDKHPIGNSIFKQSNLNTMSPDDFWVEPPLPTDSVEKKEFKRLLNNRISPELDPDQDYKQQLIRNVKEYETQYNGSKIGSKATEAINSSMYSGALRDINDFHPSMQRPKATVDKEQRALNNGNFVTDLKEKISEEEFKEYRHQYPYREQFSPRQNEIVSNTLQKGLEIPTLQQMQQNSGQSSMHQFGPQNLLLKSKQLNNLHLYHSRANNGDKTMRNVDDEGLPQLSKEELQHISYLSQVKQDLLNETLEHIENKRTQRIVDYWTRNNQSVSVLRNVLKNLPQLDEEFDRLPQRQLDLVNERGKRANVFRNLESMGVTDPTLNNALNNPINPLQNRKYQPQHHTDAESFNHIPALTRTPYNESQFLEQEELKQLETAEPTYGITTRLTPSPLVLPEQKKVTQLPFQSPSDRSTQAQRDTQIPSAYNINRRDIQRAQSRLQAHQEGRLSEWESEQRLQRVKLREHLHGRSPKHSMEINKHFRENQPNHHLPLLPDHAVSSKLFEKYSTHYDPTYTTPFGNNSNGLTNQQQEAQEEENGQVPKGFHSHRKAMENLQRGSSTALETLQIPQNLTFPHEVVKDLIQTAQERLIFAFDRNKSRFYAAREEYFDTHDIEQQRQQILDKLVQTHNHYVEQQKQLQKFLSEKKNLHSLITSKVGLNSMKNVLAQQLYTDIHDYFAQTTGQEQRALMDLANNFENYINEANLSSFLINPTQPVTKNVQNNSQTQDQPYMNQSAINESNKMPTFLNDLLNQHKNNIMTLPTYSEQRRYVEDAIWKAREEFLDDHLQQLPQRIINSLLYIQNLLTMPRPEITNRRLNRIARIGNNLSKQYKQQQQDMVKSLQSMIEKIALMKLLTTSGGVIGLLRNFFTQSQKNLNNVQNQPQQQLEQILIDQARNPFAPQRLLEEANTFSMNTSQPIQSNQRQPSRASLYSALLSTLSSTSSMLTNNFTPTNTSTSTIKSTIPNMINYASSLISATASNMVRNTLQSGQFLPALSNTNFIAPSSNFLSNPSTMTMIQKTSSFRPQLSLGSGGNNSLPPKIAPTTRLRSDPSPRNSQNNKSQNTKKSNNTTAGSRENMYSNLMAARSF